MFLIACLEKTMKRLAADKQTYNIAQSGQPLLENMKRVTADKEKIMKRTTADKQTFNIAQNKTDNR